MLFASYRCSVKGSGMLQPFIIEFDRDRKRPAC